MFFSSTCLSSSSYYWWCTHWIDYRAFWGSQFLFKLLGMWYARDLLICVRYWVTLWTFAVLLTLIFRAQRAKVWTQNKGSKNWGLEHLAGVKYSFIPPTEHLLYARHSTEYGLLFLCHFPQFLPILRQDKLIFSAILPSFRFWLKGTFLGPLVSKPFPILNSATWLLRGALKIIKKEEHEVGLLSVGKPRTYLPLF